MKLTSRLAGSRNVLQEGANRLQERLGLFTFEVFGHKIRAIRPKGLKLVKPNFMDMKVDPQNGTWVQWRDMYGPLARECVRDWDEVEWEDLWRLPEVGMAFVKEFTRGAK